MLDRLALADGMRVLEIGTGTGYHAALLCERVGDGNVTSVDVSPDLVEDAARQLAAAGYRPRLHTGDGAASVPDPAGLFDRIIATCSVRRIPPAWITQLAPGGRLVVPLGFGGALAVLDRTDDTQLDGRIDPVAVYFMPLRDSADRPMPDGYAPAVPMTEPAVAHHSLTDVDPAVLNGSDFQLWLALHHPALQVTHQYQDGAPTAVIVHTTGERAVAILARTDDGLWAVTQQNGRPWDTVESAWTAFARNGRPSRDRLGITVHGDIPHVWLDDPTSPYTWPIPDNV